jgi:hypothetical protein
MCHSTNNCKMFFFESFLLLKQRYLSKEKTNFHPTYIKHTGVVVLYIFEFILYQKGSIFSFKLLCYGVSY